jgi:hypothetical protein
MACQFAKKWFVFCLQHGMCVIATWFLCGLQHGMCVLACEKIKTWHV